MSHSPLDRLFLDPPELTVTNELTEEELHWALALPGVAKDVPRGSKLIALIEEKRLAVLTATAAYLLPGETREDNGVHEHLVGTLVAPIFTINADDWDIDERWEGKRVCEVQELVIEDGEIDPAAVQAALLDGLQRCCHEYKIDVLRLIIQQDDMFFHDLLSQLGFQEAVTMDDETSMVYLPA